MIGAGSASGLLVAFPSVIVVCEVMIALHAKDRAGACSLVAASSLSLDYKQRATFASLRCCLSKGLPLPFVNDGGSNLAVFFLYVVAVHLPQGLFLIN